MYVPLTQFEPELPDDPDTADIDGSFVITTVHHIMGLESDLIQSDLAIFDPVDGKLMIESEEAKYLGLSQVKVKYQMQDYL